jgi:hypothetical protein
MPTLRVAQEFFRDQARLLRLKRQADRQGSPPEEREAAGAEGPPAPIERGGLRSLREGASRGAASIEWWLGWPGILMGLAAIGCVLGGLLWEAQRHPPLPPGATQVQESIIAGFARQTSYRVSDSVEAVRAFYRRELPRLGWRYCGTQATPRCSNLIPAGAEDAIDVYRRPDDHDFSGLTVEIWPQRDPNGQTFVIVFEMRLRR